MRTSVLGFAIGLSMVFCSAAYAQQKDTLSLDNKQNLSPPTTQGAPITQGNQTNTQQDKAGSTQRPAILNSTQTDKNQEGSRQGAKSENGVGPVDHSSSAADDKLINLTFWLVIATIGLMVATGGLWFETRKLAKQAREASNDTKKSIEIAERSADASTRAAQAAIDAVNAERAWVCQIGLEVQIGVRPIIRGVQGDKVLMLGVVFSNAGRSPATGVAINSKFRTTKFEEEMPIVEFDQPEKGGAIIAPGGMVTSSPAPIAWKAVESYLKQENKLFVFVEISYRTISMPDIQRLSRFCAHVVMNGTYKDHAGEDMPNITLVPQGIQNLST